MASPEKSEESQWQSDHRNRSVTALSIRSIIVICVLGGFSFHLYLQCIKYMNDPSIAVKDVPLRKALFPDVTYCYPTYFNVLRLNTYKFFKVDNTKYDYLKEVFEKNLKNIWNLVLFDTTNETSLSLTQKKQYIAPSLSSMLPFMAMNDIGGGVQDSLMECRFYGRKCDFLNFTSFWDGDHGLCFHFTATTNETIPGGIKNGLSLIMHYKFAERVDITEIYGDIKTFVHPRNTYGTAEEVSGLGTVGRTLNMEYVYIYKSNLNTATSPCRSVGKLVLCRVEVLKGLVCQSFKETDNVLKKVKLQTTLHDRCNCISYEWPIPEKLQNSTSCHFVPEIAFLNLGVSTSNTSEIIITAVNNSVYPLSDVMNLTAVRIRSQCYIDFKKDVTQGSIAVTGDKLCNPESYKLNIINEVSPFLMVEHFRNEAGFLEIMRKNNLGVLKKINYYNLTNALYGTTGNLLNVDNPLFLSMFVERFYGVSIMLNLFPDLIAGRVLEEYFLYDLLYFIADMGGVTGLWVGMSIVTIFEIIEWILWKISNKCKGKDTSPETNDE